MQYYSVCATEEDTPLPQPSPVEEDHEDDDEQILPLLEEIDMDSEFSEPDFQSWETQNILDEDWDGDYTSSVHFQQWWFETHDSEANWPKNVQLRNGKLFCKGRLCARGPNGARHKGAT